MSLSLTPSRTALAINLKASLLGVGGTEPYVYTVLPGGAGGTINSSSGLYTAPQITGVDTIQVQDALNAKATASILVGNALELFCDIIQTELGLSPGRVYLWDQKISAPIDQGLWIAVGVLNSKPFGNSAFMDSDANYNQSVNMSSTLSVDIVSRGAAARDRKEEVILALNGFYSEQQQERNSFRIFPISTAFVNLSQEDGAAIPYRFNISVSVQYQVSKKIAVDYFDTFEEEISQTED